MAQIGITWRADGRGYKDSGTVEDKSSGGLGIRFPIAIPVGSIVALAQGFSTRFAMVRHCSRVNGRFFIGVEFCELAEGVKPAHSSTIKPASAEDGIERRQAPRVRANEPLPPVAPKPTPAPAFRGDLVMEKPPHVR